MRKVFEYRKDSYESPTSIRGRVLSTFGDMDDDYKVIEPIRKGGNEMLCPLYDFSLSVKVRKRLIEPAIDATTINNQKG